MFFTVTVFDALVVFTVWFPKPRFPGDKRTAVTPVPASVAVCGLPDAMSLTVSVPEKEPALVGVNVTEIAQLVLAARVAGDNGQVEV